jgi:phosphoribosylformimino-5-aminoimidazole carboxamide ribotide isomerase
MDFCREMETIGVKTLICTDISRDGAMRGTNREMYRELSETLRLQITASGGVSSLEDVENLRKLNLYGAIIGKAYYTGDIDLKRAIEISQ